MTTNFPELTYASPTDPWLKRTTIRVIEYLAGRSYFVPLYHRWKHEIVPRQERVIRPVLDLIDVKLAIVSGTWPPPPLTSAPLVIVANHPYGIVDGLAALTLAEDLGRPFRVLINKDLLKVPEIRRYALPVDFSETREAVANNIKMRNEALRLLKEGTTIVVFPAGGIATSPTAFAKAVDLPWKSFTARMILAARAQVVPMYFEGQCSPLFQFVSRFSLTFRLSLVIREFRRLVGSTLRVRIGALIPFEDLHAQKDRVALMTELWERVHELSGRPMDEIRADVDRLPDWLLGKTDASPMY